MDQIEKQQWTDPHRVLGLHENVITLWRPGAPTVSIELSGKIIEMKPGAIPGLFTLETTEADYRVYHQNGLLAHDPYSFSPTFGELDAHLFSNGVHYQLGEVMGGRVCVHQGVAGTKFSVWAPNAKQVALVADFNGWDGRVNPMRSMGGSGVWELFVPGIASGEKYKFQIHGEDGSIRLKADPYATWSELRPATASIVFDVDRYEWKDQAWRGKKSPVLNIYEVHLGSWKKSLGYREMAHQLSTYCVEMGYTHVELMPIEEHPLDESWGYQVTGFFAVTSRYGTPEDFQYFVDHMHQAGVGVILDWVPAHFPSDDFSLAKFDGSYLYEHADPRKGFHPHWNTYIFNYGRFEVSNFLIASALFWLGKMHIDGLRVDAVASMLYLDYGRENGEWIPNVYGGNENLEAIAFIKHMNSILHQKHPDAIICAEESTAFTGVTHPVDWGGLGFDLKWNMGWMNDTLRYFRKDPIFRSYHQNDLTFGILYAFSEKFISVLSHDEVVHGKGSLLSKMPGDEWQKFANLRLLVSYLICQPGKKLLFMGGEIGQWEEWDPHKELPWNLLAYEPHKRLQKCTKDLNHLYKNSPPLWELDFEWIDFSDKTNCVISYLRKGEGRYFACVHNFTPSYFPSYVIALKNVVSCVEIFNTDREEYGGSGKINPEPKIAEGLEIQLAPLATMIFDVQFAL